MEYVDVDRVLLILMLILMEYIFLKLNFIMILFNNVEDWFEVSLTRVKYRIRLFVLVLVLVLCNYVMFVLMVNKLY